MNELAITAALDKRVEDCISAIKNKFILAKIEGVTSLPIAARELVGDREVTLPPVDSLVAKKQAATLSPLAEKVAERLDKEGYEWAPILYDNSDPFSGQTGPSIFCGYSIQVPEIHPDFLCNTAIQARLDQLALREKIVDAILHGQNYFDLLVKDTYPILSTRAFSDTRDPQRVHDFLLNTPFGESFDRALRNLECTEWEPILEEDRYGDLILLAIRVQVRGAFPSCE